MKSFRTCTGGRAPPGQKRRRLAQDLVGLAQLAHFALQGLDPRLLIRRQPGPKPAVALGPTDPSPQRLRLAADLPGHRRDRRPLGAVLALVIQDHPHRPLTHLGCVPREFVAHGSILSRFGASGKGGAIHHTWVGDVRIRLTGPDGTAVTLLDRPGAAPGPLTQYGCNNNDFVAVFSDGEPDPWGVCDNEGDYGGTDEPWPVTRAAPVDPLSVFNGKNVHGTWTLTVSDNATGDTGEILDWELVPTPGFPRSCGVCHDWDILFKDGFE